MTDNKNKRHYWAVKEGRDTLFAGTHTECWEYLVAAYSDVRVAALIQMDVRIARNQ